MHRLPEKPLRGIKVILSSETPPPPVALPSLPPVSAPARDQEMRGTGSLLDSEKVITSVGTSLREFVCNTVTVSRNRHFLTQKCQAGRRHTEAKHGYDIELAGSVTRRHKITLFSSPSLCLCLYLPRYLSLFFVLCTLFSLFVCLFVFFQISFSSCEDRLRYSPLLLKHTLDQATSSASCPYNKRKALGDAV